MAPDKENKVVQALRAFSKLIKNEPPDRILATAADIHARLGFNNQVAQSLDNNPTSPIILIGQWGSGKSSHIKHFTQMNRKNYRFTYKSFCCIHSLNEGFVSLLTLRSRLISLTIFLIALLPMACVMHYVIENWLLELVPNLIRDWKPQSINLAAFETFLVASILFVFVTNRLKLLYAFTNLISYPFAIMGRKEVMIIEDLDRSAMSQADQWAMLSNLWIPGIRYIIPYGYERPDEKSRIIEMAWKLQAQVIELPIDPNINLKISKKIESEFPFTSGEWLILFPPRELIALLEKFRIENDLDRGRMSYKLLMIRFFYRHLIEKIGIKDPKSDHIEIEFTNTILVTAKRTFETTSTIRQYLESFGKTIELELMSTFREFVDSAGSIVSTASNKYQVGSWKLLRNELDPVFVDAMRFYPGENLKQHPK